VFLVPLAFDRRTVDVFNLSKITLLWVLGIAAIGAWLLSFHLTPGKRGVPRSPTFYLAIALVAVTAIATIFSTNPVLSFFGLYKRYEGLGSLVLYTVVAALITVLYFERPEALGDLALATGASAGVLALYVIAQQMGRDPFDWQAIGLTPIGSLGNSNFAAAYLGIGAPFLLYLVVSRRSLWWRAAWSIIGGASLIALWFTRGRGGMLAALVGVLSLFLLTRRTSARRKVTVIAVAFLFLASIVPLANVRDQLGERPSVLRTGTLAYRQQLWDAGVRMIRTKPILGWGPETYYGTYPRFRAASDAQVWNLRIPDKPHNIFINWAVSTGFTGLLTYLALAGSALWLVARKGPRLNRQGELLAATFGAGFVAYLAQGMFSIDVPALAITGWVALGAIGAIVDARAAAAETAKTDPATRTPAQRGRSTGSWFRQSYIPLTAVGIGLVVLIGLGLGPLRADHAAWAAGQQPWNATALYERAIRLNPHEAAYYGLGARHLELVASNPSSLTGSTNALRRSAALYERAIDIQPSNLVFLLGAARVYERLGSAADATYFVSGDRWLARAVQLDPSDPLVHEIYAEFLRRWAHTAIAPEELERLAQQHTAAARSLRARGGQLRFRLPYPLRLVAGVSPRA
jgi:O-antigen ligase